MLKRFIVLALCVVTLSATTGCMAGKGAGMGAMIGGLLGGVATAAFPDAAPVVQAAIPIGAMAIGAGAGYLAVDRPAALREAEQQQQQALQQQRLQQQQQRDTAQQTLAASAAKLRPQLRLSHPILINFNGNIGQVPNADALSWALAQLPEGTPFQVRVNRQHSAQIRQDLIASGLQEAGASKNLGTDVVFSFRRPQTTFAFQHQGGAW